jgi:hypothetical protein
VPEPPDIGELACQGVAVIVATRDPSLVPAVARGWGPRLHDGGARLELCVDAPEGSAMLENLRAGSPMAVTLSRPTSYLTVQLKGAVASFGAPDAEALRVAGEHIEAFVAETTAVGVPEAIVRLLADAEVVAVAIDVAERYDQTPGPGAGRPL